MNTAKLWIKVSIRDQRLDLLEGDRVIKSYSVSTAKNGPGEINGSECTPRGWHVIRAKVGVDAQPNTVFVKRRPTGEIFETGYREKYPKRDWILTRILWLSGLEPGKNRLRNVDTMRRYIYIHGCPDEDQMGVPSSHGCVKMRNADVVDLFERVPYGTRVLIED